MSFPPDTVIERACLYTLVRERLNWLLVHELKNFDKLIFEIELFGLFERYCEGKDWRFVYSKIRAPLGGFYSELDYLVRFFFPNYLNKGECFWAAARFTQFFTEMTLHGFSGELQAGLLSFFSLCNIGVRCYISVNEIHILVVDRFKKLFLHCPDNLPPIFLEVEIFNKLTCYCRDTQIPLELVSHASPDVFYTMLDYIVQVLFTDTSNRRVLSLSIMYLGELFARLFRPLKKLEWERRIFTILLLRSSFSNRFASQVSIDFLLAERLRLMFFLCPRGIEYRIVDIEISCRVAYYSTGGLGIFNDRFAKVLSTATLRKGPNHDFYFALDQLIKVFFSSSLRKSLADLVSLIFTDLFMLKFRLWAKEKIADGG